MNLKLISVIAFFIGVAATAQKGVRVGYIDMDYILQNVPEYTEATSQLDKKVAGWRTDIELRQKEVDEMRTALANEKVLLTKELIEEREEDILYREKEMLDFQQQCFGPNGHLVRQKQNLVQPIQDQVFNSVQQIATNKNYDYVFDKSADAVMLYTADRYDISELVLRSINRTAKRTQVNSKSDKKQLERDESNSLEQDKELQEREEALAKKKADREKLIEDKKKEREKLRQQKIAEYEARRKALIEERARRKDSLEGLKKEIKEELNEN